MTTSEIKHESVQVFNNISDNTTTFNNKEEFMKYYEVHKADIDAMKTRGLNIKYSIPGYKIGRKKNQITLFPVKTEEIKEEPINDEVNQKLDLIVSLVGELLKHSVQPQLEPELPKDVSKNKNPWMFSSMH